MRDLTASETAAVAGSGSGDTEIEVTTFGGGAGLIPPPVCGPATGPESVPGAATPPDPAGAG